jgi:catechol-2,3-dioxygenase
MVDFYTTFLGGRIAYGNPHLSFITYDEEHHRIGIVKIPGTGPKDIKSSGMEHVSFAFSTMKDLFLAYQQRKERGIVPIWGVNHGPTTSIYYRDPDRNMIETQVDNFDTVEEANEFMSSPDFAENPIGTDIDIENMIERLNNGEPEASLKKRVEIGARKVPDLDAM